MVLQYSHNASRFSSAFQQLVYLHFLIVDTIIWEGVRISWGWDVCLSLSGKSRDSHPKYAAAGGAAFVLWQRREPFTPPYHGLFHFNYNMLFVKLDTLIVASNFLCTDIFGHPEKMEIPEQLRLWIQLGTILSVLRMQKLLFGLSAFSKKIDNGGDFPPPVAWPAGYLARGMKPLNEERPSSMGQTSLNFITVWAEAGCRLWDKKCYNLTSTFSFSEASEEAGSCLSREITAAASWSIKLLT